MSGQKATEMTVEPAACVRGTLRVPGDKSISHRYAILAALATGRSRIHGYAPGADCGSTLTCLEALGVGITRVAGRPSGPDDTPTPDIVIEGAGPWGLQPPQADLDAGNSGTTMRLMTGVLAGQRFDTTIRGDASLSRRPMRRVIDPLQTMGAQIDSVDGHPPLTIAGTRLRAATITPTLASAQVKSALLLAGLFADGTTWIGMPTETRDHTERALPAFGVPLGHRPGAISITGGASLRPVDVTVPGDLSSATYWLVAAAALAGSSVTITGVGLNPSRTKLLEVLGAAGADVKVEETARSAGEPVGSVCVVHRDRHRLTIGPADVPALIDELPALAALATHGGGITVTGAEELRAKESDRISVLVSGLREMGADVDETPDGFLVDGSKRLTGGAVDAAGDHRMAMAFAIAALGATGPTVIRGHRVVDISYPDFFGCLDTLRQA